MFLNTPLALLLPGMIIIAALVVYCWFDLARRDRTRYVRKSLWALLVLILAPIGPIAYLVFEKFGLNQVPGQPPEEMTTHMGNNLYMRGH